MTLLSHILAGSGRSVSRLLILDLMSSDLSSPRWVLLRDLLQHLFAMLFTVRDIGEVDSLLLWHLLLMRRLVMHVLSIRKFVGRLGPAVHTLRLISPVLGRCHIELLLPWVNLIVLNDSTDDLADIVFVDHFLEE